MNDRPAAGPPEPPDAPAEDSADDIVVYDGAGIVNAAFLGTGALLVAAVAGATLPDTFGTFTAVVSAVLFVVGVLAFLWGYATGVVRSREERITFGGLFFLVDTAPRIVRFRLLGAFAAQVVIAVVAASIRLYTSVAFTALAPMLGLGLLAAWGARHGEFPPKEADG